MCLKSFVNVKPYHDDRITLCGVRVHVPSLDWLCARVSVCVSVCVCVCGWTSFVLRLLSIL